MPMAVMEGDITAAGAYMIASLLVTPYVPSPTARPTARTNMTENGITAPIIHAAAVIAEDALVAGGKYADTVRRLFVTPRSKTHRRRTLTRAYTKPPNSCLRILRYAI